MVEVTRLFGHFLDNSFYKVFSYKLKLFKDCAREYNRVNGVRLSGSKLLIISSILCTKNSLNLSGRYSGEIFEGSIVSPNLPII